MHCIWQPNLMRLCMVPSSQAVQQNSTLYVHVVFADAGHSIDPEDPNFNGDLVFGRTERRLSPTNQRSSLLGG